MTSFLATYSDWKPIKTRRVIQIVFEVPWEGEKEAYHALDGMPDPGGSDWYVITKHEPNAGAVSSPAKEAGPQTQDKPAAPASRSFSLAQRIGALCTKPVFHRFLADVHADRWNICNEGTNTDKAALIVRSLCGVKSRADIEADPAALDCWKSVAYGFDRWQSEIPF